MLLFLLLTVAGLLLVRYVQIQLFQGRSCARKAKKQHQAVKTLHAERGTMFDRQGRALTKNCSACSILFWPAEMRKLDQEERDRGIRRDRSRAERVASLVGRFGLGDSDAVRRQLETRDGFYCFASGVDYTKGESLHIALVGQGLNDWAVVTEQHDRAYPYGETVARLVGHVQRGEDAGEGRAGLELFYDSLLTGSPGWVRMHKDRVGFHLVDPAFPRKEPVHGADINLTIDLDVQEGCYRALAQVVDETRAISGSAVVLDARTGAVLAMCDYPSYVPEEYGRHPDRHRCAAVADLIEPGSSFKVVIAAAALEDENPGAYTRRLYDVSDGAITIQGKRIGDVHKHGVLSFDSLLILSSNPGVAMLAQEVAPERFYRTARELGFGEPVGIGLPGEAKGMLDRPGRMTPLRRANMAFGQGVAVSLLQMAGAYLCIANEGKYLRPYLVESMTRGTDTLYRFGRAELRQALKPVTARRLKRILGRVVTEGTGPQAAIRDVAVCGKTGTAQKLEWNAAHTRKVYSDTKSLMSFCGFLPREDPRYVIAVMVDEPKTMRFASSVACPAFRDIGLDVLALERLRKGQAVAAIDIETEEEAELVVTSR